MLFVQRLEQREKRFLVNRLHGSRDVLVFLLERLIRLPRRAEKIDKVIPVKRSHFRRAILPGVRNVVRVMTKIFEVQPESSIGSNANDLAQLFEEQHPDLAVHKQLKELRTGRVLIDWSQNDQYKTTVNVYSLRARTRPTVSTPVSWDEVERCLKAGDPSKLVFDSDQVLQRVAKLGDLFEPVIKKKQKLPRSLVEATGGAVALEKMAKTAPKDGVVRGSLSQMNVIDLMQSLEMGRKSCQLSLSNEADKCEVFFVDGQVKHATYGKLVGDEAVFKVLRWTGGNFQLDFEGKTDKETTQLNTQGLLMEGLRLLDESAREGGAEAEPEAAMAPPAASAPSMPPSSAGRGRREEEEDVLLDG